MVPVTTDHDPILSDFIDAGWSDNLGYGRGHARADQIPSTAAWTLSHVEPET